MTKPNKYAVGNAIHRAMDVLKGSGEEAWKMAEKINHLEDKVRYLEKELAKAKGEANDT